jgi:ferredoxin
MTEFVKSQLKTSFKMVEKKSYLPTMEEVSPDIDGGGSQNRQKIQQFFRETSNVNDVVEIQGTSVLVGKYLNEENFEIEYPLMWDYETKALKSFRQMMHEMVHDFFISEEAERISGSIPAIIANVFTETGNKGLTLNYINFIDETISQLESFKTEFSDPDLFINQCKQLKKRLLTKKVSLIEFSGQTPFKLLNIQLRERKGPHGHFLKNLQTTIEGLNEILLLNGSEPESLKNHFKFADDLVSLDRITDITPKLVSSSLSADRVKKLRQCHQVLTKAQSSYLQYSSIVFVRQTLVEEYELTKSLDAAKLVINFDRCCEKAKDFFYAEMHDFVEVIKSLKLADLEIHQKYEEALHKNYFEAFDASYLSEDDLKYFRPIILIEESRELMPDLQSLLSLLSEGSQVKVLALNTLRDTDISVHQIQDEVHLELGSLAFFRRHAYVFQGAADTPLELNHAIKDGLDILHPALWNVLVTSPESDNSKKDYASLRVAIDSRWFPRFTFDVSHHINKGNLLDISKNLQPDQVFPSFNIDIKTSSGHQSEEYIMTIGDLMTISQDNLKTLLVLKTAELNDDMIPVAQYLDGNMDALKRKFPSIWLVDQQQIMKQAVVPVSWIKGCRARVDYWHFLQELSSGSLDIRQTIDDLKSDWELKKEAEIEEMKAQLLDDFNRTRERDLELAISRMLNGLLGSENGIVPMLESFSTAEVHVADNPIAKLKQEENLQEAVTVKQESSTIVKSDAWVETDECTSCSDCIDALPGVFKYNSDKQAIVHNPKGGPYAKIVAAAEKCPAACIHPGLPHNTNEPNIEKLIKRAEKFN